MGTIDKRLITSANWLHYRKDIRFTLVSETMVNNYNHAQMRHQRHWWLITMVQLKGKGSSEVKIYEKKKKTDIQNS